MGKLLISLAILFFSSVALGFTPNCNIPEQGSTIQVIHVNSPCSPFRSKTPLSWEDTVLQMQSEDKERLIYLSNLVAGRSIVPVASGRQITQNPTYILRAKIGTPPQTLLMALDTSSDAAWIPCSGCAGCGPTAFDTAKSTSFKNLSCGAAQCKQVPNPSCVGTTCGFNLTYGSSSIAANLVQDTVTLATDPIPGYTFGCIQKATGSSVPAQGLLGLGRGPLSLWSQTQNLYKATFSYCLPSYKSPNFSGSLRLGPNSQPIRIKYTQLLKNPRRSSLYYVNLVGIKVGKGLVKIPPNAFAHDPNTGSGTVIDSGTVFTRLVQPAYIAVRDAFRRRMGNAVVSSLGGFDTCYTVPVTVPSITFLFSGMNMSLAQDNFLIRSAVGTTSCLAMAAAPDNVNSVLNVIANFQQQNHRILIDVPNSKLGVARETCT
ncbi:Eukaryotic aspartyl protease family protein [Abeliophyllum distichum]|uniref:Eukaryotic aspartyl protease family protein n=1 Tax=Abeliophyllum distichum TaxID=126358 RepID=A0ABD1TG68_9LAMI